MSPSILSEQMDRHSVGDFDDFGAFKRP